MSLAAADAIEDAKTHARACFPNESCGYINAAGAYVPCANTHRTPETHFEINDSDFEAALISNQVRAIVHSHPNGPAKPSHADMQQQGAIDLPWIIVPLNNGVVGELVVFGAAE